MKTAFFVIILVLATPSPYARAAEQTMTARVTVYWKGEPGARASWNGARLCNGSCAVDPKKIAYGSKVIMNGDQLTAVDTGPAVVNRRAARTAGRTAAERNAIVVDRFFETRAQAYVWEKSHPHFMTVRVLEMLALRKRPR